MRCLICLMAVGALTATAAPVPPPPKGVSPAAWEAFGRDRTRLVLAADRAELVEPNPYAVSYNGRQVPLWSSRIAVRPYISVPLEKAVARKVAAMLLDQRAHVGVPLLANPTRTLHVLRLSSGDQAVEVRVVTFGLPFEPQGGLVMDVSFIGPDGRATPHGRLKAPPELAPLLDAARKAAAR